MTNSTIQLGVRPTLAAALAAAAELDFPTGDPI